MYDAGPQYHFTYTVTMQDRSKKTINAYGWNITGIKDSVLEGFMKSPGNGWGYSKHIDHSSHAPQVELEIKICKD